MSAWERRQRILEYLCIKKHSTYQCLAREFEVSKRTVQNDIQVLMSSYPIETVSGRYGGGIRIPDWFQLHRRYLNPAQIDLLKRLRAGLSDKDRQIIDSILSQFAA